MYSKQRPYLDLKSSILDVERRASRFFGASQEKESMLEKPYRQQEYRDMHLSPDKVSGSTATPPVVEGALRCFYDPSNCELGVNCYAGSDIKIRGGPQALAAGYLDVAPTSGLIISSAVSGTENRRLDLVVDSTKSAHEFEVRFADGWGQIHKTGVALSCGYLYFDNNYWSASTGSWTGSSWLSASAGTETIWLNAIGTWASGFRPASVVVTSDAPAGSTVAVGNLFVEAKGPPNSEIDLTSLWLHDINYMYIGRIASPFTITAILFKM